MNKGTAIVGFILCFLAGVGLMYGIDRSHGVGPTAVSVSSDQSGQADQSDCPIPVTKDDPQWGNSDALVTIVEISDFQCPYCSRVGPTMDRLKREYGPEKLRVVWKHHPLPFHSQARPAHEAAATVHALAGNDAFWKFHDLAFQNQKNLNEANFEKWAAQAGVDVEKFNQAFKAKKHAAKVDADIKFAADIGSSGTPSFRINGVDLSGAQPYEKFKAVVEEQLGEAQKLVASGTAKSRVYVELVKKNAKIAPAGQKSPDAQQRPQEDDTTVWKVPISADDPQKGPADALVTVVVFSEFQCPFCKKVEPTVKQIVDTYGKDVRIVWKDNPLAFHPRAVPAATLAFTAFKQKGTDAFWQAHSLLFESQPKLEDADLEGIAKQLGLSWAAVKKAIDSETYKAQISADQELASDLNARGTPHFFVNGRRVKGAQPFEKFKTVIDGELAKAKALVAKGIDRSKVYEEIMKAGKEPPPPEKKEVAAPPADAPVKGPRNAKVTIQEFSDFQCPYCKRVIPAVEEVLSKYRNDVRLVWRHMPLPFHKEAPLAAEATVEARKQKGDDAFWKFHDRLWQAQSEPDGVKRVTLEKIAGELGLDMAAFKKALDERTHKARVEQDAQVGQNAGIRGTPGFVINGYFISGAQPASAFDKLIKLALKEAR